MAKAYYNSAFPAEAVIRWLTRGGTVADKRREVSVESQGIRRRYIPFKTPLGLRQIVGPHDRADVGAVYTEELSADDVTRTVKKTELRFDIDANDYGDIRECCGDKKDICATCWPLMVAAAQVVRQAMADFGYTQLLVTFSGGRGVHIWVCDPGACELSEARRSAIVSFLKPPADGECMLHIRKVARLMESVFVKTCVAKWWNKVLAFLPNVHDQDLLRPVAVPAERYDRLSHLLGQERLMRLIIRCVYPRLDYNVTLQPNHLLRLPFSVHKGTGKLCVPLRIDEMHRFDPAKAPTVNASQTELAPYVEIMEQLTAQL